MDSKSIIAALPYGPGFRFVDAIDYIDESRVKGSCYLKPDWPFFKDHFVNYPVVPGVILTEVMAQIGLACLAVYLNREEVEPRGPAGRSARPPDHRLGAGAGPDTISGMESGSGAMPGADSSSRPTGRKLWAFSAAKLQFLKPVFPGQRVWAESERIYYRFGKLKCRVRLYNDAQELVSEGVLEGLLVDRQDGARRAGLP